MTNLDQTSADGEAGGGVYRSVGTDITHVLLGHGHEIRTPMAADLPLKQPTERQVKQRRRARPLHMGFRERRLGALGSA